MRSRKGERSTSGSTSESSVIVHTALSRLGDMGVYVDALGTVTPESTLNIFSQIGIVMLVGILALAFSGEIFP